MNNTGDILTSKALIIPAAGAGKRMDHSLPKPFIKLENKPILEHTLSRFLSIEGLKQIVVASSGPYIDEVNKILRRCIGDRMKWQCVEGGVERQYSIAHALQVIDDVDLVLVHDAVRPFVQSRHIDACCKEAEKTGAAILGVPVKDTIKKADKNGKVRETLDRAMLWQIQTPQVFKKSLLGKAYRKATEEDFTGTDDASLVEWLGKPVKIVKGSISNIKITYPQDLELAKIILQNPIK